MCTLYVNKAWLLLPVNANEKRLLTIQAVFPANVSQELSTNQLTQIIRCEFVTSKIVSHSQEEYCETVWNSASCVQVQKVVQVEM